MNNKGDENNINFGDFQRLYGDPEGNIEKDYENFLTFQQERAVRATRSGANADIDDTAGNASLAVGKSKNINSNVDFTGAGVVNMSTKHVPYAVRKGGQ